MASAVSASVLASLAASAPLVLESPPVSVARSGAPADESRCTSALLRPSKDGTHALSGAARATGQTLRANVFAIANISMDEGQIVDPDVGTDNRACHAELEMGQRALVDRCQSAIASQERVEWDSVQCPSRCQHDARPRGTADRYARAAVRRRRRGRRVGQHVDRDIAFGIKRYATVRAGIVG